MFPFFEHCKVVQVKAPQTSAGTQVDSDEIDTRGFEGVVVVGSIATANAGNFAKVSQAPASGGSFADLEGSKRVTGDNADSFMIDIRRPLEPFLKVHVVRAGANTATGDIYAILYGPRAVPVAHGATIDTKQLISPAEGTA